MFKILNNSYYYSIEFFLIIEKIIKTFLKSTLVKKNYSNPLKVSDQTEGSK